MKRKEIDLKRLLNGVLRFMLYGRMLWRAKKYQRESEVLNEMYANAGCFEGPYSYSKDLHDYCDEGKRRAVRLYKRYMSKDHFI